MEPTPRRAKRGRSSHAIRRCKLAVRYEREHRAESLELSEPCQWRFERHLDGGTTLYYFRITSDKDGYRARFYYNQELIWWTEGYVRRAGAENAIRAMRGHAASAPLR
jgi:uncharacterized protein YegP (UPF0339 family)